LHGKAEFEGAAADGGAVGRLKADAGAGERRLSGGDEGDDEGGDAGLA
jgi:hypothetical protein